MIYVGIDVAKDKHDCFIVNSDGEVLKNVFSFSNNISGFNLLLDSIPKDSNETIKVGLEATGHYSINLISFLCENNLDPIVFNPLQTNLFRKAHTLRKTKTDKTDAKLIALMLSSCDLQPYLNLSYHLSELKSLTRHKFRIKNQLSKLKVSLTRIVDIVFPELPSAVYSIHQKSSYALLYEFSSPLDISNAHLTKLSNILSSNSHGKYSKLKALEIRSIAKDSIGTCSSSLKFELKQTIDLIRFIKYEIDKIDFHIKSLMNEISSPIVSVPGISHNLGAVILAEIGDIRRFNSPAQLLAFAGLDPSTHQSGKFNATNTSMVKRGSPYLRWALLQAARLVAMRDTTFRNYYLKKKSEGKHHYVAQSHVAKKLVRVLFYLLTNNVSFQPQS